MIWSKVTRFLQWKKSKGKRGLYPSFHRPETTQNLFGYLEPINGCSREQFSLDQSVLLECISWLSHFTVLCLLCCEASQAQNRIPFRWNWKELHTPVTNRHLSPEPDNSQSKVKLPSKYIVWLLRLLQQDFAVLTLFCCTVQQALV